MVCHLHRHSWKYDRYIAAPLCSLVDLGRSLAGRTEERGEVAVEEVLLQDIWISVNLIAQPTFRRASAVPRGQSDAVIALSSLHSELYLVSVSEAPLGQACLSSAAPRSSGRESICLSRFARVVRSDERGPACFFSSNRGLDTGLPASQKGSSGSQQRV